MTKKSSRKNKNHSHNQKQKTSVFDTMSTKELMDFAAERFAYLLWQHWQCSKKNNRKPKTD